MKIYIKSIKQVLLLLLVVTITSCEDTDENHKEYLEAGEILYTTKPTLVDVFVGNGRIQLKPELKNAFPVKDIIVYWNKGADSKVFPFTKTSDEVDAPNLIISGLEEKTYLMDLYTRDSEGNKSLKISSYATSYGEEYRSELTARPFKSFVFNGVDGLITWSASDDLERGSNLEFTNLAGDLVELTIPQNEATTSLVNLDVNNPVTYTSLFVPTGFDDIKEWETSIDKFPSDSKGIEIPANLKTVLATITTTPINEGIQVNWTNADNSDINISVDYTIAGDAHNKTLENSVLEDGKLWIQGLEDGAQDITITIFNQSGSGFGNTYNITPTPINYLDRSVISIVNLPTDAAGSAYGGSFTNLFDDNLDNWYHTTGSNNDKLKHHFTMDLQNETVLTKFRVYPRLACCQDRNPSRFQLWGRVNLDGDAETTLESGDAGWDAEATSKGWILLLDEEPGSSFNGSNKPWTAYVPDNVPVRYVRFRFISAFGSNPNETALAEFEFWKN